MLHIKVYKIKNKMEESSKREAGGNVKHVFSYTQPYKIKSIK